MGSAPYIVPVVKTVYGMMKDGAKKAGGSGGLRVHALMRMAGFAMVFLFSVSAASVRRIVDSFKFGYYHETRDAGKAGVTELMACTIGLMLWLVFFFQRDVLAFFKLAKPRVHGSSVASAAPSAKSKVAPK